MVVLVGDRLNRLSQIFFFTIQCLNSLLQLIILVGDRLIILSQLVLFIGDQ